MSYYNNRQYNNFNNRQNQGFNKRNFTDKNKNTQNRNKYFKPKPEYDLVRQVQAQAGIGKSLILYRRDGENSQTILHTAANKINSVMKVETIYCNDVKNHLSKLYQLKIGDTVIVKGSYESIADAKKNLSDLALEELQKVCFTIIKKTDPRDLPKVEFPSSSESQGSSAMGGIGAQMMTKMGWSGKGLGSQEQGRTDIVKPHFHINRQGFGSQNITEEVREVLEKYSASQDYNSIAFSPDFSKEERAAIHTIARKLNLRTRSYGKNEERFLIVENRIRPWDLIYLLLEVGNENEQYKGGVINGDRHENANEGALADIVRGMLQDQRANEDEEQHNFQPDGIENANVVENQNIDHEEGAVGGVENVNVGGENNPVDDVGNRLIPAMMREDEENANPARIGDDEEEDNNFEDLPDLENVENGNMAPNENPNDDLDD